MTVTKITTIIVIMIIKAPKVTVHALIPFRVVYINVPIVCHDPFTRLVIMKSSNDIAKVIAIPEIIAGNKYGIVILQKV
jgi:hypothetical protein